MAKKDNPKKTKKDMKAEAIAACKDSRGRIRPEAVVKAAEPKDSILHDEFEWDDKTAAAAHRLLRARQLIREVRFTFKYEDVQRIAPYYVSDVTDDRSSYIETVTLRKKKNIAKETLNDEMSRIKAAIHRACTLAVYLDLHPLFQRMLALAVEIEGSIGGDDDDEAEAA